VIPARTLLLAAAAVAVSAPAAHASGVRRDVAATTIFTQYVYLEPNSPYTIETLELSAGGDTVLHVVPDDGRGVPLASNDDCPGSGSLRSCLTIPAASSGRLVAILVRSYSPSSIGAGVLRVCGPWCSSFWMPRYAGISLAAGETIGVNARVMTVRRPQQPGEPVTANDTVLLARSATATVQGFDDEHGLQSKPDSNRRMSRITMALSCQACALTIGVPQWAPEGLVTLMWDTGGNDCDADGWSDGLEAAAGGDACNLDADNDGLKDGEEFHGVEVAGESLQFPFWGANPRHKDVFVETDWVDDGTGNPTALRMTTQAAADMIGFYANDPTNSAGSPDGLPGITVHIDNGLPNNGTRWGNWGGATMIAAGQGNCVGRSAARERYFRHGVLHGGTSGNGGYGCYNAMNSSGWLNAHELGHSLGLNHGGTNAAVQANCKPHYRSLMSYAPNSGFSTGGFASTLLNPTALDETNPFGTSNPAVIGYLGTPPWNFTLGQSNGVLNGNVDWNRDGLFEDSARGAPNFVNTGCEFGMMHRTVAAGPFADGFQSRMGSDGIYWFGIGFDSKMTYRKATDLSSCNQSDTSAPCPSSWSAPVVVASGTGSPVYAAGAAAAEWYQDPNNWFAPTIVLVYKRATDQRLMTQTVTRDWWSGGDVWSSAQPVTSVVSPVPANAEPTLVNLDNQLLLYLPDQADRIREYRYDPFARNWTEFGVATDVNQQPLQVGAGPDGRGMGVVIGYQDDGGTVRRGVYGALRATDGRAQMVRRESNGQWTRMPEVLPTNYWIKGVPRLGYVPFRSNEPSVGRFHLLYRPAGTVDTVMAMTEGNSAGAAASVRRLRFIQAATVLNYWPLGTSSYSLLSDPDGLRATFNQWNGQTKTYDLWYLPFVDGVYNANFADVNDFFVMGQNLRM
jgi:hypothetical protein